MQFLFVYSNARLKLAVQVFPGTIILESTVNFRIVNLFIFHLICKQTILIFISLFQLFIMHFIFEFIFIREIKLL